MKPKRNPKQNHRDPKERPQSEASASRHGSADAELQCAGAKIQGTVSWSKGTFDDEVGLRIGEAFNPGSP